MSNRLWRWLRDIPVANDIERRNGAFFQLFLVYFGVTLFTAEPQKYWNSDVQQFLLAKVWGRILPWPRAGMWVDIGTDVAMAAVCVVCFWVVREGRFSAAVRLFLSSLLGLLTLNYMAFGSTLGTHYFNLTMIIAALMLGRRALWIVFAAIVLNFTVGTVADSFAHFYKDGKFVFDVFPIASVALSQLVVAALLDQTVKALRDALAESERNGAKLAAEILEREKTQQQVIHLEKMRAVGQLASGTAHDFNNILGVILGFARERRRPGAGAPGTPRERVLCDALEGIDVAARRGASISRKLLDFSRAEPASSQSFDAVQALEEVRPMLRQLLPEPVRLVIEAPPGDLIVRFDREQFELALLNLAANARDAMPGGGTCRVEVSLEEGNWVRVAIGDTGEGMSEETRRRVLEPFFTTKPPGVGTGLGLSVVHGMVERSGGRMTIASTLGQGTTVTLWLREGTRVPSAQAPREDDDIRVLLVDDDDVLRGILVSSLEDYGYRVEPARDGRSALRSAEAMQEPPDVIVCDHHMPDMDGATVMRRLWERFPDVPAILISTHAPVEQGGGARARTYRLPKPFSPDHLARKIYDVVGGHRPL